MAWKPPTNKDWMKAPIGSDEYFDGVEFFLKFVTEKLGKGTWSSCPCAKCRNSRGMVDLKAIFNHLIRNGIDQSYTTWYFHGELFDDSSTSLESHGTPFPSLPHEVHPQMFDSVNDTFDNISLDDLDTSMEDFCSGGSLSDPSEDSQQDEFDGRYERKFKGLWYNVRRPLYPSCKKEHTKLAVIVELMNIKTKDQMSDTCFTDMLNLFKCILPEGNILPVTTYEAKTVIKSLGMEYETIDACPNDCVIYWRENE